MRHSYRIAGHCIRIEGVALAAVVKQIEGFAPFEIHADEAPLATFTVSETPAPAMAKILYQNQVEDVENTFGRYAEGYLLILQQEDLSLRMWVKEGGDTVYFQGALTERLLRFALWIAYGIVTAPYDTVAIHTSAIQHQGKAVLFLGESGTGKSTHTRLWREHIPGAELLNDDSPILRIIEGVPYVFGSPWSGKTPCYKNEQYPLAGCVRLSQAPYNRIKRLDTLPAYGALHPSCPPDFAYDNRLYDCISHVIGRVLETTPIYHLACLPDAEAAKLSCVSLQKNT